ncbi:MAG: hypothetical protein JWR08_1156 [Enterovirga sp.]|nr:hypothetical protein [Enterovirga sp.]
MFGSDGEGRRPSILIGTVKMAGAVAVLAYGASVWLSGPSLDYRALSRIASAATRTLDDPITTGSIRPAANSVRLDPCVLPGPR